MRFVLGCSPHPAGVSVTRCEWTDGNDRDFANDGAAGDEEHKVIV